MLAFLKVFGRGVLVTVLLPFILLIWVLYGVYCVGAFIFMFFKSTIDFFKGKSFNADLPEDLEARRIILEKEKSTEQATDMLNMMYKSAMAQTIMPPEENDDNKGYQNEESYDYNHNEPTNDALIDEENSQEQVDESYGDFDDDLRSN